MSCRRANFVFAVLLFVEGKAAPCGKLLGAGSDNLVKEAGNENVAVLVLEFRNDVREGKERIGRRAAVHAGMKIGFCAAHFDLGVDHAAQADAKRRKSGSKELGVANQRKVGFQVGRLRSNVVRNSLPSHLFLAFEKNPDVEGQRVVCGHERLERLHLRDHLALVVDRTAGVEVSIALCGLEGRREPLVERVGRLNIVVTVDEHGRLAGGMQPVGVDQRMAFGLNQSRMLHANALQIGEQRLGGFAAVVLVLRQSGNRRNA